MIIDSQIHVWWPNSPARPWPPGAVSLHGPSYTIEDAVAQIDTAGVKRAVLVPPSWTGIDNSYGIEAAQKHPGRFAVMGLFDHEAAGARESLKAWRKQPGMLGIRPVFANEKALRLLNDPANEWFWDICERDGIPLMCFIFGNLKRLDQIAQKHPGLKAVVDHAGRNPRGAKDEAAWADLPELLALARHPNISVKVSSLPCFTTQAYPYPNLHGPIKAIYDAFGPQRMMWGSDITRLTVPYMDNLRLFQEGLPFLSEDDKSWIMGRAVAKVCGWPL
ncbi:MAG: amidohydrolase family protein [Alphaproteobacteria bacterium]|nr:amidohydrolase family protein [Alphaproteobacteria bacterium]